MLSEHDPCSVIMIYTPNVAPRSLKDLVGKYELLRICLHICG